MGESRVTRTRKKVEADTSISRRERDVSAMTPAYQARWAESEVMTANVVKMRLIPDVTRLFKIKLMIVCSLEKVEGRQRRRRGFTLVAWPWPLRAERSPAPLFPPQQTYTYVHTSRQKKNSYIIVHVMHARTLACAGTQKAAAISWMKESPAGTYTAAKTLGESRLLASRRSPRLSRARLQWP